MLDLQQDLTRDMLRHTLATLAYRARKAVAGAPAGFADFRAAEDSRRAGEILAHLGDLMAWARWLLRGKHVWEDSAPLPWEEESARFFRLCEQLDADLVALRPVNFTYQQIFQGPIADALTHVGQINLLRRLAGAPVRGENYARAEIVPGRVGPAQAAPRVEFD